MSFKDSLRRFAPLSSRGAKKRFDRLEKRLETLQSAANEKTASKVRDTLNLQAEAIAKLERQNIETQSALRDIRKNLGSLDWKSRRKITVENAALLERHAIEFMDVRLVDHCNLNCVGCNAYSPLAPESYLAVEDFENDLQRLHDLIGDRLLRLNLMGGEPLLHPNAEQFAIVARKIFSEARINYTTNGLKVFDMPDSFWGAMRENDIELKYTKYPIKFDYQAMEEYVASKGVTVFYIGGDEPLTSFRKLPLDPRGFLNTSQMYVQCPYIDCVQLRNGRLYRCPPCAMSDLLNDALEAQGYNQQFRLTSNDYLTLDEATSKEEVFDFLSRPIPFCQYCNLNKESFIDWRPSKRDIREWVDL